MVTVLTGLCRIASIGNRSRYKLVAVAMAYQYAYILGTIAITVIGIMTWRTKGVKRVFDPA